jgi:predicted secreted protein
MDTDDATTLDSVGGWEEVLPTVLREGEVKLDLIFDPADDTHDSTALGGLGYAFKNKLLKHFKIVWPDTTLWTFPGYVTAFEPSAPVEGKLAVAAGLRISGAPILA